MTGKPVFAASERERRRATSRDASAGPCHPRHEDAVAPGFR